MLPWRYIVVEGVIGVGKTSLTKLLSTRTSGRINLEVVEENPFLKKFYDDIRTYAFQTQIFFLLSRFRQQQQQQRQEQAPLHCSVMSQFRGDGSGSAPRKAAGSRSSASWPERQSPLSFSKASTVRCVIASASRVPRPAGPVSQA